MIRYSLLLLVLLLGACAQAPVSFDYDPAAYLRGLKSYAISPPKNATGVQYQSLDNNRIEAALRSTLSGHGFQQVPADKADFWVSYRIEAQRKISESGISYGFGISTGNLGVGVNTGPQAKEIVEGKLVVDVVDPARKQVIWSAKANRFLTDSMTALKREQLINSLVSAMFQNFPPN